MDNEDRQKIELIGVDILDRQRPLVEELKSLAEARGIDLGWHYLLDLAWIISQLELQPGMRVLDAGAGTGLMQWYLAGKGVEVISVDRASRIDLPLRLRAGYRVNGLRKQDLASTTATIAHDFQKASTLPARLSGLLRDSYWALACAITPKTAGQVTVYQQDLGTLADIPDAAVSAVVAVSSLEHNPPEGLERVVRELMRVIRPGGALLATLGAAPEKDWFHQPSQGWCYSAETLRARFDLPEGVETNYERYDPLFSRLSNCAELRDHLADFYFRSGDNGMPWGKWDPQYQPVGVRKAKPTG